MGGFWQSLLVAGAVVAALYFSFSGSLSPLFALGLVAFSSAGYFALSALEKAGFARPKAEWAVIGCSVACLLLAALYNSSLQSALPLLFLPVAFSVAAVVSLAGAFASQVSG